METTTRSSQISRAPRFQWPAATTFLNRQWWWTTLLVLVGIAVLVRLGIWQLDRLEQRRSYNARIIQQLAQPPIMLTADALPTDLADLEDRQAKAQGEYDLSRQIALVHQNWMNTPGFHLLAPLVIEDGARTGDARPKAVLVDRGWLPAAQQRAEDWSEYRVLGPVTVTGYIKLSQTLPGSVEASQPSRELKREWYRVDIPAIETQMPYELLPVYLQQGPSPNGSESLPFRSQLDADLSEGNHLSYAIQWFIFATILGVGYIYYVGKRTNETVIVNGE